MEALEDLVRVGKIRYYGWSTDDVERARVFARRNSAGCLGRGKLA
jgi:aryl-alcohol dehydrogenase-like predicted oxidoreductase